MMCYINWTPVCSIYSNSRWIDANLFYNSIESLYWCTNLENFYTVLSSLDDMCDTAMASRQSRFPSGSFILYDDPILQTIRADIEADIYHDNVDENLDRIITFINFNKINRNSFESILNITWNTTNCHHG